MACAFLLGAVGRPADAGDMPSKRYRDPNAKFSFRIFEDWDPVPVETRGKGLDFGTDKYLVVKYMQTGADKRGLQAAQIHAFRMGQGVEGQSSGETTPGETAKEEDAFMKRLRELVGKDDPKTMKELFEKTIENYGFSVLLDPKAAKEIKSKDGVVGQLWVLDRKSEHASPDSPAYHLVFATWKRDKMELGLWLWCGGESKKKFEQGFLSVAKSFVYVDAQAEDVKTLDCLKDLRISPGKKREIEKGLVKGWDVMVSPKKNYIVIYNTKGKRNNLLAKIISDRIEKIREQVYEVRFPPAKKIEAVSIVRICGDRSEYHAYGGPGGSAGYWSNDTEELVFYDASPSKEPDDDTLAVLYHEAFHQFIYYSVGKVSPHSWFNEGTGDYFSGSRYTGGKFAIRPFNWRVGTIQAALRKGPCLYEEKKDSDGDISYKFDRSNGGYTPLKPFVHLTQRDYYSYPDVCYAQGWSFIYFLREAVPKNPKWNEKWGKILETYFEVLKREAAKETVITPTVVPGMDDPGMGEPGMEEPGMAEPGMEEPGMDDPGMEDPGMGEPGMEDPGMGDPAGGEPSPDDPGIPLVFTKMFSSDRALTVALDAAFKGVDFDELEAAWKAYTLKVR